MTENHHSWARRGYRNQPTLLLRRGRLTTDIQRGILAQATEYAWRLMDLDLTQQCVVAGYNVVGAIAGRPVDHPEAQWLRGIACPVVRVGRLPNPLDSRVPAVILDNRAIGRLAAEHFAERNFRQVGVVKHSANLEGRAVWQAFRQRARELGCTYQVLRLHVGPGKEGVRRRYRHWSHEVAAWLAGLPKPIAVFALPPHLGAQLITMVHAAGWTIPEEVAVLGCLNDPLECESTPVPLSAIDLNRETQGREAVRLLHRLVAGEAPPREPLAIRPSGVVERHSTHVLAVPDPVVSQALRYMWDHLDRPLCVESIAAEVGVCRRTLERGFRQHLQRGVSAELQRKRLELCCELLTGTDLTVREIAARVGYASGNYLQRSFKKAFGQSPGHYRRHS